MDVDNMLAKCGNFGRYQYMLLAIFSYVNILSSMHYYSQTIISFVPDHWCYSEMLTNCSFDEIAETYSKYNNPSCAVLNQTSMSPEIEEDTGRFTDPEDMECHKWFYNRDYGYQSMTADFDWVCQSAWKSTLGQSMFFIGCVVGTLCFGIIADKIGRLPVLIVSNMMAFIGNGATIFATDVKGFIVCRFISGMATDSNFVMMYILVMEYMKPSMRTFGLNLCIGIFYCIGSIITPWIAVAVGSWKLFLLVTVLPIAVVPTFYFILPESAQWLIAKGDIEGAVKCFQRVAKVNKRFLDDDTVREFRQHYQNVAVQEKTANSASLLNLFRTKRLRRNTCILLFKSMVITLCYDAISRNVEGLGVSPFIMFSISALAIFPACVVILLLQDKIGRKAMASSSLLVSGIFTSSTGIIIAYQSGAGDIILITLLAFIGRFGVTIAYNSGAQYATELIPTCVRAQGVAAVHVAGYAFTFFSSHILYLSNIFKPLPPLILGLLSIVGAILCLFLPETLNRTIPCTLEDGENFGRGERIFDFACFDRKNKTESTDRLQKN